MVYTYSRTALPGHPRGGKPGGADPINPLDDTSDLNSLGETSDGPVTCPSVSSDETLGRIGKRQRNQRNRQRLWNLALGNWNISSIRGKEVELVEEAAKYRLDIVGVSSTK